ncbi:MAG: Mth938-like domain-containing protein [Gammaproteobacteria bacterium]
MQFNLEAGSGIVIRSYSPGELRVNDRLIGGPVILTQAGEISDWAPPGIAELGLADFATALAAEPEVIVFGSGETHAFPPTALITAIMRSGIGFEAMATAAACRTFNVLAAEGRRVAAALMV